ncbi:MAG: hypothetical protein ACM3TN_15880 [Alphaproteobacteria bacterium]
MKLDKIFFWQMLATLLAIGLGNSFPANSAETNFSGITEYVFEPNPQKISPKMYNWEIKLSKADSQNGAYEIVQITRPRKADSKPVEAATTVLIESKMIVPNRDEVINFKLYVSDKEPKQNMGRRGNIGQPIIFSGRGTGKGESNWIVLPGSKMEQVAPSVKGAQLSNGQLNLIQFIVTNDRGEKFQADVILRRK